jgi:hypothetical protein
VVEHNDKRKPKQKARTQRSGIDKGQKAQHKPLPNQAIQPTGFKPCFSFILIPPAADASRYAHKIN